MPYDPERHRRRSIRLRNYDYTQAGAYFITICLQHRECLFGEIIDGTMHPNDAGHMVAHWFAELEHKFYDIECDEFTCMPNHAHFITVNAGADLCAHPDITAQQQMITGKKRKPAPAGTALSEAVQWFKTMTTNAYIRGVKQSNWQPFPGKLWQRNYWDHIIRNESELRHIRKYIRNNPALWEQDQLHPDQGPFSGETREFTTPYGHEVWMV